MALYRTAYKSRFACIGSATMTRERFDARKGEAADKCRQIEACIPDDQVKAAFAAGVTMGYDYPQCCLFASAVSALKCTGIGARESAPDLSHTRQFLAENGVAL